MRQDARTKEETERNSEEHRTMTAEQRSTVSSNERATKENQTMRTRMNMTRVGWMAALGVILIAGAIDRADAKGPIRPAKPQLGRSQAQREERATLKVPTVTQQKQPRIQSSGVDAPSVAPNFPERRNRPSTGIRPVVVDNAPPREWPRDARPEWPPNKSEEGKLPVPIPAAAIIPFEPYDPCVPPPDETAENEDGSTRERREIRALFNRASRAAVFTPASAQATSLQPEQQQADGPAQVCIERHVVKFGDMGDLTGILPENPNVQEPDMSGPDTAEQDFDPTMDDLVNSPVASLTNPSDMPDTPDYGSRWDAGAGAAEALMAQSALGRGPNMGNLLEFPKPGKNDNGSGQSSGSGSGTGSNGSTSTRDRPTGGDEAPDPPEQEPEAGDSYVDGWDSGFDGSCSDDPGGDAGRMDPDAGPAPHERDEADLAGAFEAVRATGGKQSWISQPDPEHARAPLTVVLQMGSRAAGRNGWAIDPSEDDMGDTGNGEEPELVDPRGAIAQYPDGTNPGQEQSAHHRRVNEELEKDRNEGPSGGPDPNVAGVQ